MSAKDKFHEVVKIALEKDNWIITHDPDPWQAGNFDLAIDLGAEKILAAEKENSKIAVEIKSFLGASKISQFYGAIGQFITYRFALNIQEAERILYLAVDNDVYEKFFSVSFIQKFVKENKVYLLVYDIDKQEIEQWIK